MAKANARRVPALIAQLYDTVWALNKLFPDRPFTPDGHLVGSIGEVIAAYIYGLELEKCSNAGFDAKTQTSKTVECWERCGAGLNHAEWQWK